MFRKGHVGRNKADDDGDIIIIILLLLFLLQLLQELSIQRPFQTRREWAVKYIWFGMER